MRSIFIDDFPLVKNNQELQVLIGKYLQYDGYYVASGAIKDRREKFNKLYNQYYKYADINFLSDAKKQFHQRVWEMFVGCVLLDNGLLISSKDDGPDVLIEYKNKKIWVECIACKKGEGVDHVPSLIYGIVQSIPTDKMLLRISSALKEKYEKYIGYLEKGLIDKNDPFIIAVNSGALKYPDGYVPLILRCLFGVGYPTISMPIGGGPTKHGISTVSFIEKKNKSKVPMTFFWNKEHSGVSAVIYSGNTVLDHPDTSGKDIMLIHNPNAKNPIPNDFLNSFR